MRLRKRSLHHAVVARPARVGDLRRMQFVAASLHRSVGHRCYRCGPAASANRSGQEEFGPYELVENWPQPLPDGPDGVKA
jgi:hypothetical protein